MNADHVYLEGASPDRFGALLLELASQLHVERQRRIALETVLQRAGVLTPDALDAMANEASVLEQGRSALDASLRRLMRIMAESGESRGPLRQEAPG